MIRSTIAESSPSSLSINIPNHKPEQDADTDIVYFEFSLLYGEARGNFTRLYNEIGDAGDVQFTRRLSIRTGKAIEAYISRNRIGSLNDDSIQKMNNISVILNCMMTPLMTVTGIVIVVVVIAINQ